MNDPPNEGRSSRDKGLRILRGRGFQPGHLFPKCLDILLHKVAVVHGSEQDTALTLTLPLSAISAAFGSTTGWHTGSGGCSGGSKKRRKLDITIPDSISSLLFRHDVIESLLGSRELALRPICGNFSRGIAVLFWYHGGSGCHCARCRKRRWNERRVR